MPARGVASGCSTASGGALASSSGVALRSSSDVGFEGIGLGFELVGLGIDLGFDGFGLGSCFSSDSFLEVEGFGVDGDAGAVRGLGGGDEAGGERATEELVTNVLAGGVEALLADLADFE